MEWHGMEWEKFDFAFWIQRNFFFAYSSNLMIERLSSSSLLPSRGDTLYFVRCYTTPILLILPFLVLSTLYFVFYSKFILGFSEKYSDFNYNENKLIYQRLRFFNKRLYATSMILKFPLRKLSTETIFVILLSLFLFWKKCFFFLFLFFFGVVSFYNMKFMRQRV